MLIQQQHNSPTTEVQQGEILIQQQLILTNHKHSQPEISIHHNNKIFTTYAHSPRGHSNTMYTLMGRVDKNLMSAYKGRGALKYVQAFIVKKSCMLYLKIH